MSEPAATPGSPTPKKRLRRFILILGIAALLLAVLVWAAPWIVGNTGLRDQAINTIVASPTVTASTESGSFGWFSPLSVQGADLQSSNKRFHVRAEEIATESSPYQLWTSAPHLGTIRVKRSHVRLELPLDPKILEHDTRLEPAFTAIVKDGILTVHRAGDEEPIFDVDEINITFRIEKTDGGRVLTLDPLVVFDKRKLTPKLAKSMLHLFDPSISDIPQVSGEISLSLDKVRIPLGVPKDKVAERIEVEGKLHLHNVATEPRNPMRKALVQLVADMNGMKASDVVRLAQDAEIRFHVHDGRLHHEGLRIGFPDIDKALQVTSRGSIGLDRTLDLHVELPRLDPALRKTKEPAKCHITGTIAAPKLKIENASLVLRHHDRKEPIIAVDDLNVNMRIDHAASGPVLAVEPVTVFKKAKLNVVAAKGLVALIAPDVDSDRQVKGEISLELDTLRIPLGVPRDQLVKSVEAKGKLTLHHVATEVKTPMWQAIVKLLADMNGKQPSYMVRLADGAEIQFHLRDGRLHHDGLRVGFPEIDPDLVVSVRGSVGADETLDLHLEIPRLRKEQRDRGPVQCRVTGTLHEPKVAIPNAALVVHLTDADKATLTVDNVHLNLSVETTKDGRMLTAAPMTLFDKKKLTPEVGDRLLHLIAPTLAELSGVQGEISLSFDTFRVPLGVSKSEAIKKVELAGKLHLHQISVSTKTPLVQTMVKVLADMYGKKPDEVVRVVKNAEVRFQVRDGRMHHEGMRLGFPDIAPELVATSQGYVGYDSSLDIVLEVPRIVVNKKDLTITKGQAPVRFRITGTIEKPNVAEIKEKEKTK